MKPYAVKLFWNEPDGEPNMMMANIMAETITEAVSKAIEQLHHLHFIVDPHRVEATLDTLRIWRDQRDQR